MSAPRVIRAWGRRRWIEQTFRTLKHLWAAEVCQVQTAEAYDGHLVWRLLAGLGLFSTARCCWQGRVTMEAIVFRLTHHGRFLTSEPLEYMPFHGTSAWRPHEHYEEQYNGQVSGYDFLPFLVLIARVADAINPFWATVLVPSPWSTPRSRCFSAERCTTLAMNACSSRPIIGPFGEGSVNAGVMYGRLAIGVFRDGHALPRHPGIEHP